MAKESKEETKGIVIGGILIIWLMILTAFCIVNFVSSIEKKPLPKEDSLRLLRSKFYGYQIQVCDSEGHWECANKRVLNALDLDKLQEQVAQIGLDVACLETGGHNWSFKEKESKIYYLNSKPYQCGGTYVFKCSKCGRKRWKESDELTPEERDAFQKLNMIGE